MSDLSLSTDSGASRSNPQAEVGSSAPPSPALSTETAATESEYPVAGKVVTLRSRIAKAETEAILGALENTDWNRKRAAQLLAISYRGLLYKIRRHNIIRAK
jgi:transcriptional regulator with GAF, ATPase, and Fis domain